ncbi:bifunctional phosphoribosylaminoimidazolecarboxamide formyltransferase/IMP cyclohydrolase [soil metagenome]
MAQQTALVSVSDKSGLTDLVKALAARGVRIVSTGGTAAHLRAAGVAVMEVSELTKFPEILDGRVKTLHPAVHSGLLARRDEPAHMETLDKLGLGTIDYVIVNLYPFVKTAADATKSAEDVIEQIDIGGPSMLRSAAKNFHSVTVVCDPADYARVAEEINRDGQTSESLRADLAAKVFTLTSSYDTAIANFLHSKVAATSEKLEGWPAVHGSSLPLAQPMRYGENPHQAAAFYRDPSCGETSLASSRQLHGKELSYNNILDAEGALEMVRDFADLAPSAAVIVKHSNPCGIALGDTPLEAYHRARETDPDSAFGGIVAFSSPVDKDTAEAISASFNEIVIAPDFTAEGLEVLRKKKNLRVLATGPFTPKLNTRIMRGIVGGAVVTDRDLGMSTVDDLKFVSMKQPEPGDR